jgi:anthranilate synthase component II
VTPPRVFVLDNYDSFTFNLVQFFGELGASLDVERNDACSVRDVQARRPDAVVISPGPGVPRDAGISIPLVCWCVEEAVPLLGVCLGHQAIAEAFGAVITPAPRIMHGKTSPVTHDGKGVFRGLPESFEAGRYHSLVIEQSSVPLELEITAWTDDDTVMGLRHRTLPIEGVQFHPESILTAVGMELLRNFLYSPTVIVTV